jgi:hypothetical protein
MILAPERGTANPYCPEHVLVAEKQIGRRLKQGVEVVHHINGVKSDNRPENLLVCTKSEHRMFHRQLEEIGYALIQRGLVAFVDGTYVLK